MSSSVSSRASLPATSALVMAVSTIRRVDGAQLVARLDRGGQVGAELVLEGASWVHCGSLDPCRSARFVARALGLGAVAGGRA